MIVAEDVAAPLQRVLVQVAGGLRLAQRAQVGGQVARGAQCAEVIPALRAAIAAQGVVVQVAGRPRVAQHAQIHG